MATPRKPRPKKDATATARAEADTANILVQAGLTDLRVMTEGQTFNLPVVMAPSQPRLFADTIGVSYSFSGYMDLTLLTLRQNFVSQTYAVTERSEKGLSVVGGALTGGPLVMEEGTVRVTTKTALQLAGIIINQLRALGLATDEEIEQATKPAAKAS